MKTILNFLLIYALFCGQLATAANIKLSALPSITEDLIAVDDIIPLVDTSAVTTKKMTFGELDERYLFLDGTSGGQIAIGGTAASDSMTLKSTSDATKGDILLAPDSGEQVGIGVSASTHQLHVELKADDNFFLDGRTNPRTVTVGAMRQEHTAGTNGTRASLIDFSNANTYGDTKGIHVNANLNGNSAALTSTGILLSADVAGTTNATHDFMVFQKTGTEGAGTELHALHVISSDAIAPLHHLSGAVSAVGQGWKEESGPSYTDTTTAFGSSGTNTQIFTADNDRIYVSNGTAQFNLIEVVLAIVGNQDALVTFEYSLGSSAWGSLPASDGTGGFTASGNIDFEPPVDWATDTVNAVADKYWVRITRTRNSLGTPPTESTIKILKPTAFGWDKSGDVSINDLHTLGAVNVGSEGFETSGLNINGVTQEGALRVNDFGATVPLGLVIHEHSTTDSATLIAARSKSDTSSHGAVALGDPIFDIEGAGYTGSHYDLFAGIEFLADDSGTISSTSSPGQIQFLTTTDGVDDLSIKMTIDNAGFVGIGDVTPLEVLDVTGNIKLDGHAYSAIPSTMIPAGTTQTINWDIGAVQIIDLASATGDVTLTLSNLNAGATVILKTIQGATARDLVWPAAVLWQGGTAPVICIVDDCVDVISLLYDGTNYYGNFGQLYQ